jgi:4-amino-4-deoxy-L-arabinose transferase-like glycosyltransferase
MTMPQFAWLPVGLAAVAVGTLLGATANRYGYERDELYFRVLSHHLSWGYADEPPLTPMLARAGVALFGDNLWALRTPAIVCAVSAVVLCALLVRELGGALNRREATNGTGAEKPAGGAVAQGLAAAGASSTFLLIAGHVLLTVSLDLVVWLTVLLFASRALLRDRPKWWIAVGLVVGVGLYNKQLVILLLLGLALGLVLAGPRRMLRSPWLWGGAAVALIGLPNLLYQIAHHWPEVTMAQTIAANKGHDNRIYFLPYQLLWLGFTEVPIWIIGLAKLLRAPAWRPVRALGLAYPIVSAIVLATGGGPYYTAGLIVFLYTAGCVEVTRWAARRPLRWAWNSTAVALAIACGVAIALPIIPIRSLPPIVGTLNQTARDSVGWQAHVDTIGNVYWGLSAADRSKVVIFTENYGEAGALDRFGPDRHLPSAYSGQNELFRFGPPPDTATVAIEVGTDDLSPFFENCATAATLDNGVGVDNEEQRRQVSICRGQRQPWSALWPKLQHYG